MKKTLSVLFLTILPASTVYSANIPSTRTVNGIKARIKKITKPAPIEVRDIVNEINPVLRGRMNYFRHSNAAETFYKVHRYAMDSVRKFIRRNQKKTGYARSIITNFAGNRNTGFDKAAEDRIPDELKTFEGL